jgi:hypothetical protein
MIAVSPEGSPGRSGVVIAAIFIVSIVCLAGMVFGNSLMLNPPVDQQDAISTGTFYGLALTATGNSLDIAATGTRQSHSATQAAAEATAIPVQQTIQAAWYPVTATAQAFSNALQITQGAAVEQARVESRMENDRRIKDIASFSLLLTAAIGFILIAVGIVVFLRYVQSTYRKEVDAQRLEAEARLLEARAAQVEAEALRIAEHRRLVELRERQRAQSENSWHKPVPAPEEHPYPVTSLVPYSFWNVENEPQSRGE